MCRIKLKPNSADYLDDGSTLLEKRCDMPGCEARGTHRAPRNRDLNKVDYHYFCLDHVQEYNQAWNFFDGMSNADAQDHIRRSYYGDRPTWKFDGHRAEDALHEHINRLRHGSDFDAEMERDKNRRRNNPALKQKTPETEALEIMDLNPPLTQEGLKTRYKELVKQYHPDLNGNCKIAEGRLKEINMAYTVLKVAYECFTALDE